MDSNPPVSTYPPTRQHGPAPGSRSAVGRYQPAHSSIERCLSSLRFCSVHADQPKWAVLEPNFLVRHPESVLLLIVAVARMRFVTLW
jgi:hypothetical protein